MSQRIEDYALIGDLQTAALVGRDGSVDWLCLPRFDSGACFAALLGDRRRGRWLLAPAGEIRRSSRRYRSGSLVLETEFEGEGGRVTITDCMPPRDRDPALVRVVTGIEGRVLMQMELVIRFEYGSVVPWIRRVPGGLWGVAGPDAVMLQSDVETSGRDLTTVSDFTVGAGERRSFVLTWRASHRRPPGRLDAPRAVRETDEWWRRWSVRCVYRGPWRDQVLRSLITLKALTYRPTGGVIAAATTSLPEQIGGGRNWDYRYCWIRDATFTLYALMSGGYRSEARAWRDWLLRSVAGRPEEMQIVYGPAGERRLDEKELDWLPGYEGSRPVRIGNAAQGQFQLDVYGEVMDGLHQARMHGISPIPLGWDFQRLLMDSLESRWRQPDEGIWEMRGPPRHFTHSKVMAWVAMDRAIRGIERHGLEGPLDRWRSVRDAIHQDVCRNGYDPGRNTFTQTFGSRDLDASLLMIPLVGFLPPEDRRVRGTVEAIQRELTTDGFVMRYPTGAPEGPDGLSGREGAFLACTFWLVDNLCLLGRRREASDLFERLLSVCNDVGLLSEEYDPSTGRLLGNFPQAFSHVGLINSALNLSPEGGPAHHRGATRAPGPG
ncbi:MAG TPA: glycoside hydrolase family 15 protein [Actinomycetota bacterium]|nr:glycoside hydrolase family 15 protein [Actinomycetota bacterium]